MPIACRTALPVLLLASLPLPLASCVAAEADAARPNVVVVMADDMGFSDVGCYGGEIATPHLDRLAANGVRFSSFYNTGRCCPTRASLLTGLYPHQAGVGHMVGDLGRPGYQGYLDDRAMTVAEALKASGYQTLMTGKWHVGSAKNRWPTHRGFDRYFGTPTGGGVYFKSTLEVRGNVFFVEDDQRVEIPDDFYVTDAFTDYALDFVRQAASADDPFFLYLAHIAPHWPLQAKPEDIARYRGRYASGWDATREARYRRQVDGGLIDPAWRLSDRDPQAGPWDEQDAQRQRELARRMEIYAAQVDCIDQNIGRLVATLEELDRLDNTLILFLSDNGCSAEGGPGGFSRGREGAEIGTGRSYASAGLEWANASDTPFRKFKKSTHEGGIATPLIAHWPARLGRPGRITHQVGHVIDLLPTCLDAAGASMPEERDGEPVLQPVGQSLLPAIDGGEPTPRQLYWEHEGNRAVRDGDWKLVAPHNAPWELYDLRADRTETTDLAEAHPERADQLQTLWQSWADRSGVERWPVRK